MKKRLIVGLNQMLTGICLLGVVGCDRDSTPKGEITLQEINRVVGRMSLSHAGPPRTIDELTNFPAFKGRTFPTPPAGKKFILNPSTREVVIADQ